MNSRQPKSKFRLPPTLRKPWNISTLVMAVVAVLLILLAVLSVDNISYKTGDYLAFTGSNKSGLLEQKSRLTKLLMRDHKGYQHSEITTSITGQPDPMKIKMGFYAINNYNINLQSPSFESSGYWWLKWGDDLQAYLKKYFIEPKDSAVEWIKAYEAKRSLYESQFDYWLEAKEESSEYTGYDDDLRKLKCLRLTRDEMNELANIIPAKCKTNIDYKNRDLFQIRVFKRGQKLFPLGLKAFRISVCQYAVNFPPLTAKYIYEKFTEDIKTQSQINIWDPSSGWGGRILGAMSVENDTRRINYIGTDPNTDHNTETGRTKYHELADFYNKHTDSPFATNPPHSYEFYQCGSEEMCNQPGFQKYKGKLDLVFTSPPYFAKELYSDDETQSATKFNTFDAWVEGFLRPTLETAVEWLAPNRYLLWNIADAKFANQMLPLEKISCDILQSLGMKYEGKLKMALAQMPGGNRVDPETGKPLAKNFCRIREAKKGIKSQTKSIWFKYEPVFIFKKV